MGWRVMKTEHALLHVYSGNNFRDSGALGSTYSMMQRYVFISSKLLGSGQCRFGPESFLLSGAPSFAVRQIK